MFQIIIGILFGAGLFFIAADSLKIPSAKSVKAMRRMVKRQSKKPSKLEGFIQGLSGWLAERLKLNEYKRMQLIADLQTAGMTITPEQYIANAIVKAGICGLLAVPAFFLFPLLCPIILAVASLIYFRETRTIQERIRAKREAIEFELPHLVFTISQTIPHNRDILSLLENYQPNAGKEFREELAITVADMRSSNHEAALTRLESRVGSTMLSDVTRGFISVLRGDDTQAYWAALSIKFADIQRQALKRQAVKVPSKVRRLSMLLLVCFIATYMVVLGYEIMQSLGAMFG